MPIKLVKRGSVFYIRGTVHGQSVYESTRTSDKQTAETFRAQREARLIEEAVYGKKAVVTFYEAAISYVAANGSPRFLGEEREDGTRTLLIAHFGDRRLHTIQQKDLDDAAAKIYPRSNAETRNRQVYTPFIAVWNHAVRNGWADMRLWSRPKKAKGTNVARIAPQRSGTKPVSYERAAKFVLAMSPAPAMVMTTLFYTGMRPIEVFALECEDVDISGRWLVLPSSKTGEPRGVPMHEMLVPLFTALKPRGGRVFLTYKMGEYPLTEDGGGQLKTAINGARERTGIKDISPYTARHTVSTQLVVNGVHSHVKDQILGHAADDMSRHYTNVPQAPLIEAINTLPVIPAWRDAEWLNDPLTWQNKLVRGGWDRRRAREAAAKARIARGDA